MLNTIGTSEVLRRTGVTYRMLDYWCRTGVLRPEQEARGSGTQRRFLENAVRVVAAVMTLAEHGAEQDSLRPAAAALAELPEEAWAGCAIVTAAGQVHLWTPGETPPVSSGWLVPLYECGQDARMAAPAAVPVAAVT